MCIVKGKAKSGRRVTCAGVSDHEIPPVAVDEMFLTEGDSEESGMPILVVKIPVRPGVARECCLRVFFTERA